MSYAFLGGVVAASTTIRFDPGNFFPFAAALTATAVVGLENDIEPASAHAAALVGGFLIGNIISSTSGKKNKKA